MKTGNKTSSPKIWDNENCFGETITRFQSVGNVITFHTNRIGGGEDLDIIAVWKIKIKPQFDNRKR